MSEQDRSPLLALGALTLVAALGFEHIFGRDHSYRPVVYGAAVLPVAVFWLGRRSRLPALATLGISVVGLALYVAWTIVPGATWHGVPTPGTVRAISDALSHTFDTLRTDVPPIPVSDGYLFLATCATVADGLARPVARGGGRRRAVAARPAARPLRLPRGHRTARPVRRRDRGLRGAGRGVRGAAARGPRRRPAPVDAHGHPPARLDLGAARRGAGRRGGGHPGDRRRPAAARRRGPRLRRLQGRQRRQRPAHPHHPQPARRPAPAPARRAARPPVHRAGAGG